MARSAVSVVLPVANQADHIRPVVDGYVAAMNAAGLDWELILVVNFSRDASLETCKELAAANARIHVVESDAGWGRAVRAGIEKCSAETICYTNSARTGAEDLVLALRYALVNPRIAVKASRKVRDSLIRRFGSVLFNFEARALFGLALWDINGTPKVFQRSMLPALGLTDDGDLIDLEFAANCRAADIPVLEMPTYPTGRHGGVSTTRLGSAWRMYLGAVRMYVRRRRKGASVERAAASR